MARPLHPGATEVTPYPKGFRIISGPRLLCLFTFLATLVLQLLASVYAAETPGSTLLFQNLRKLSNSIRVDNPAVPASATPDGPKGLASADLNSDGWNDLVAANADGTVAVVLGGPTGFAPVQHIKVGDSRGFRDVITANVNSDARPEIIAAHPFEGKLYIFSVTGNVGNPTFSTVQTVSTWLGARSVVAGDFNGDGRKDLAVGGPGEGFREYRGNGFGGFTALPPVAGILTAPFDGQSAKPVFTMHVWRRPGESSDQLVLSFADSDRVWFLKSPSPGQPLAISSELVLLPYESVYDLAMAYTSQNSRTSGYPDLITAATLSGEVYIRRYPYQRVPDQRLAVPGAPRALSVADVNDDQWPDLLVAARNGNTLSLYRNVNGTLTFSSQTPAGSSPRDVVTTDFGGNGLPDAAVINRVSLDITVHGIDPVSGRFLQNPLVLQISGGATSPSIQDVDGDGKKELLYLTPATGQANIQKLESGSRWLPAARYSMGVRPRTLSLADINSDGRLDLLSTSLGFTQGNGSLSYRLQLADRTFGQLVEITPEDGDALLTESTHDFNGDGRIDRVVLYLDSRIAFFEGTSGGFENRRTEYFLDNARSLLAVDLDQDGDLDLVGVGAYGQLAVVENDGRWFTRGPFRKTTFSNGKALSGVYAATSSDITGDGYPDLTLFAKDSVTRWNGAPGLSFEFVGTTALPNTLDVTEIDFDGDAIKDVFALRPANTTVSFFKGTPNSDGEWWKLLSEIYAVPSVSRLVFGDLDGDDRPDLVGVGEHIWAVLSGTPSPALVPMPTPQPRIEVPGVIINEILASTTTETTFIPPGRDAPVDCVEIFNGTAAPVELAGWKLRRLPLADEMSPPDFIFPSSILAPGELTVVYCSKHVGMWDAPFKLPGQGCTLQLLDANGDESDSLSYPFQQSDISYARLFDGALNFVYNPFPSIGNTNYDNGSTQPSVSFKGIDLTLIKSGTWRFRCGAWALNGLSTLVLFWKEITTAPQARSGTIPLFDDGMHDDGASQDGVFAGDWDDPLPAGTPIEFYITVTDLYGQSSTQPNSPQFTLTSRQIENYNLAIPAQPSGWEISEVVSDNVGGLADEGNRRSDWVELRYTGSTTFPVQDLFLADSLFGYETTKLYDVSRMGSTVLPGTSRLVFLDGSPVSTNKVDHGPFKVSNDGDSIYLIRRLPNGTTELVDGVKVPPLSADVAYARLGAGGPFVKTTPTPRGPNAPAGGNLHIVPGLNDGTDCLFVFPGTRSVEASSDLQTWTTVLPTVPYNGIEHTYREPMLGPSRFFRLR